MLIVGNTFVIQPHLRKLSYDPVTSFEPICYRVHSPMVIAVNNRLRLWVNRAISTARVACRMTPNCVGFYGPLDDEQKA